MIDRKRMNREATEVMKNIGVNNVTGDMPLAQLDIQARKLVEIAKVVMKEPDILVIDKTSTALSQDGRGILYSIMKKFQQENKSVIFISHDLEEIMEVCDTLNVLRDGKIIRTFDKEEFEAGAIRASMIGRVYDLMKNQRIRQEYKMKKKQKLLINALPFLALAVLLIIFCGIVQTKGYRLDMYLKIIFNEGVVLSIVATGAIFIRLYQIRRRQKFVEEKLDENGIVKDSDILGKCL